MNDFSCFTNFRLKRLPLLVIQSGPIKSIFPSRWLTCTRNVPHQLSATFKMVTILSEKRCAYNLICGEGQIEGGVWEFPMKAGTSRCICPLLNNCGAVIHHEWHWHTIPQPPHNAASPCLSTGSIKSPTSLEILRLDGGQQRRHGSKCELYNCSWRCVDQMYELQQSWQQYPVSLEEQFFFLTAKICLIWNKTTCGELESKVGVTVEFTLHSLPYFYVDARNTNTQEKKLCSALHPSSSLVNANLWIV